MSKDLFANLLKKNKKEMENLARSTNKDLKRLGLGPAKKSKSTWGPGIGLTSSSKDTERDNFTKTVRDTTFDKQKGYCADCRKPIPHRHMQYHHKNFDRSEGTSDNCVALCPMCHKDRHDKRRITESDKKKKARKRQSRHPFGINLV